MNETDTNQRVAERICHGEHMNGHLYRIGDFVALLDGKVIGVSSDIDGALRSLRSLDPDPQRGMIFEVSPKVTDVIR